MEIATKPQDRENPSFSNSPNSNGSCTNSNGSPLQQVPTAPVTPKPISRSEPNPHPTTFVQADTTTFKKVVQMLTGSSETTKQASKPDPIPASNNSINNRNCSIPPIRTGQKKQGFKLYERRNSLKNGLMISPLIPAAGFPHNTNSTASFSPRNPEILSPSILDFPSLVLSPVTPLNEDTFNKSSPLLGNSSEEDKAIAEKKFYLHPSPRTSEPPQLLHLFPVTSPRLSGSSS